MARGGGPERQLQVLQVLVARLENAGVEIEGRDALVRSPLVQALNAHRVVVRLPTGPHDATQDVSRGVPSDVNVEADVREEVRHVEGRLSHAGVGRGRVEGEVQLFLPLVEAVLAPAQVPQFELVRGKTREVYHPRQDHVMVGLLCVPA